MYPLFRVKENTIQVQSILVDEDSWEDVLRLLANGWKADLVNDANTNWNIF